MRACRGIGRTMIRKWLEALIDEKILERIQGASAVEPPEGYNPLSKIRGRFFHWIAVPFNGVDVYCQLRCPNATQIEQCGDISVIGAGDERRDYTHDEIITMRNYQEALAKLVLNRPTFDEIGVLIGDGDFVIADKKKRLAEIRRKFDDNSARLAKGERAVIETEMRTLELELGFILPDDTMTFLTRWAMGGDVSQAETLTKESLVRAAGLAKAHGKAPTDYISGVFTDRDKADIDARAFMLLQEHLKKHEMESNGKTRTIGGPNG